MDESRSHCLSRGTSVDVMSRTEAFPKPGERGHDALEAVLKGVDGLDGHALNIDECNGRKVLAVGLGAAIVDPKHLVGAATVVGCDKVDDGSVEEVRHVATGATDLLKGGEGNVDLDLRCSDRVAGEAPHLPVDEAFELCGVTVREAGPADVVLDDGAAALDILLSVVLYFCVVSQEALVRRAVKAEDSFFDDVGELVKDGSVVVVRPGASTPSRTPSGGLGYHPF